MWINIESFKVVIINNAISYTISILSSVILKALSSKIFFKARI
jgi:hypothetical protein